MAGGTTKHGVEMEASTLQASVNGQLAVI